MNLLINFDLAKEYYNIDNSTFSYFSNIQKTSGFFKRIKNTISGIFAKDYQLCFLLDNDYYIINDNDFAKVEMTDLDSEKMFNLFVNNRLVLQFCYHVEKSYNDISPFEYLDDDDFDWGTFLANIINKHTRKENFINNVMNNL